MSSSWKQNFKAEDSNTMVHPWRPNMSLLVNQQIWKNNTTCLKMCHSSVSNGWKSLCFRGRRIFILVVVLWRCNCLNALKYFVIQPLQTSISSEDPTVLYGAPHLQWSQHVAANAGTSRCGQCWIHWRTLHLSQGDGGNGASATQSPYQRFWIVADGHAAQLLYCRGIKRAHY